MEGNVHQDSHLMHRMLTGHGSSPMVTETLIDLLEKRTAKTHGLVLDNGQVYVLAKAIHDHFRQAFSARTSKDLGLGAIDKVLKNLVQSQPELRVLPGRESEGLRMWCHIDTSILLKTAQQYGHKSSMLEKIVAQS